MNHNEYVNYLARAADSLEAFAKVIEESDTTYGAMMGATFREIKKSVQDGIDRATSGSELTPEGIDMELARLKDEHKAAFAKLSEEVCNLPRAATLR